MAAGDRAIAGAEVLKFPGAADGRAESVTRELVRVRFTALRPQLVAFLRYRLGSTAEAEDAAQTVFVRIWERCATLTDQNIDALMFVIARNLAVDLLRTRSYRLPATSADDLNEVERIADDNPSAERVFSAKQDLMLIQRLLDELPAKCRYAFHAYKFRGEDYAVIAASMGVTESMVRKGFVAQLMTVTKHSFLRIYYEMRTVLGDPICEKRLRIAARTLSSVA